MKKITSRAHSNIAFIKYWGRKDELLRLPTNGSISMNLSNLFTTTTVEFSSHHSNDDIVINGERNEEINKRVVKQLDRIRTLAKSNLNARIVSQNSFASSAGMASSASGFAALTFAAVAALELELSEQELSILARQGSGSACRSIPSGFVEWKDGDISDESYAYSLYPPTYWDICDVIAVISKEKKEISTSEGQQRVESSIFFENRIAHMKEKNTVCKELITKKDFNALGKLIEMEALELHSIMLTSWPALIYLEPTSLAVMKAVVQMRNDGVSAYFTIDAGPNIHIICQSKNKEEVAERIQKLPGVLEVIENVASKGTYLISQHLF